MVYINCKGMPSDIPFFLSEISRMTELNAPELHNCDAIVQMVQGTGFSQREYYLIMFYEVEKNIRVVKLPYVANSDRA